jgi:hypothetical protein
MLLVVVLGTAHCWLLLLDVMNFVVHQKDIIFPGEEGTDLVNGLSVIYWESFPLDAGSFELSTTSDEIVYIFYKCPVDICDYNRVVLARTCFF